MTKSISQPFVAVAWMWKVSKEEKKVDHTGEERTRGWGEQQLYCHTNTSNSHTHTCIAHTHLLASVALGHRHLPAVPNVPPVPAAGFWRQGRYGGLAYILRPSAPPATRHQERLILRLRRLLHRIGQLLHHIPQMPSWPIASLTKSLCFLGRPPQQMPPHAGCHHSF